MFIHTWHDPFSDVGVFLVEDPPAANVGLPNIIRRVFVAVKASFPQPQSLEESPLSLSDEPISSPVRYHQQKKMYHKTTKSYKVGRFVGHFLGFSTNSGSGKVRLCLALHHVWSTAGRSGEILTDLPGWPIRGWLERPLFNPPGWQVLKRGP